MPIYLEASYFGPSPNEIAAEKALKKLLGPAVGAKKAYSWYKAVRDLFDENTRDGGYLKLGIKLTTEIGKRLLGRSISSHPFFSYHKAHIQALAEVLNVIHARKEAAAAFNRAVAAADASAETKTQLLNFRDRSSRLGFHYIAIHEFLRLRAEQMKGVMADDAVKDMREEGLNWEDLVRADDLLTTFQARWSNLLFDAVELLIMLEAEVRAAREAMDTYNKEVQVMASGRNLSRVASLATENDRQWAAYDRAVHPSAGKSEMAVTDPVRYATIQRDAVAGVVNAISEMVDFVHGAAVIDFSAAGLHGARLAAALSAAL